MWRSSIRLEGCNADRLASNKLVILLAKGDSMEPTIPKGSKVVIREQSDVESGELAAVLVNGDSIYIENSKKQ